MLRATPVMRAEEDTAIEPLPVPDAIHDPHLEETLRRLVAPPAPPAPTPRPATDRAVYGLD